MILFQTFEIPVIDSRNRSAGVGMGVETRKYCAADNLDSSGAAVYNPLLKFYRPLRHFQYAGEDFQRLLKQGGFVEIAVYVYNQQPDVVGAEMSTVNLCVERRFGDIHQLEIYVVVHVSEHVDVAEAQLYRHAVYKFNGCFGYLHRY